MVDPRLNSVHLETPRREEFRRQRQALLDARGWQTMMAERDDAVSSSDRPYTIVQNEQARAPAGVECWLQDQDYVYPLRVGLNTVGRSPDNDVVVQDGYVSRRHCAILVHAGRGCELHDIASKNGTYLNGARVSGPTRLRSGDEIVMCDRKFVFISRSADADPISPTNTLAE